VEKERGQDNSQPLSTLSIGLLIYRPFSVKSLIGFLPIVANGNSIILDEIIFAVILRKFNLGNS
jgi:hypothetical protein